MYITYKYVSLFQTLFSTLVFPMHKASSGAVDCPIAGYFNLALGQ